jgi:hypothetical protein
MLDLLLVVALILSNLSWWIYVRHLSGVTSDLKDAVIDVKNAAANVGAASKNVAAAAVTLSKP